MVDIPENQVTAADLATWYKLQSELAKIKAAEALLRSKIFKYYFPNPTEGTNNFDLKDGTGALLKATHVINRSVDPGSLDALKVAVQHPQEGQPRIVIDDLIKYTPELKIAEYRKLTTEERHFLDQCLIIKPGSPQLKIEIPKRPKK